MMGAEGESVTRRILWPVLAAAMVLLAACASPVQRAEKFAAQDEWLKAVLEYRKAFADRPRDIEYRSRLRQAELKAADFYYQRGVRQIELGYLDGAIVEFQQGLVAMLDHAKLQQAMADVLARKEATRLYGEGLALRETNAEEARARLRAAVGAYPAHKEAAAALAALEEKETEELTRGLALTSRAPVTLNFRQTDLRQAFEFLARSFGVNIIFDEGVKSAPVTLFTKDVTFDQGLNLLLTTSRMFHKRIGPNTILIAPDSKEKRGQYEDHLVRNFQLNVIRAKDLAEILKGVVTVKKVTVNEELNTLVVRDTEEVLRLVERMIEANDRKPAEIILDVEILEVNRTKSERLGLDLGTYSATVGLPSPGTVPISGSITDALQANALLTLPSATLNLFKQDVDAQILANPKVRVIHGKAAKIHIGDRVPLRAATIIDATGQTRTTFDYKDIGIRLTVEPTVHLDNSSMVKLGLEVSSLGENLGTTEEPAFRIGTRNADTSMLLRDGETAILGGLIRDEERNTRVKVPGLGDIPAIGRAFASSDDSKGRTDVLLTITPRVVRGWQPVSLANRQFYSGTENAYRDTPLFAALEVSRPAPPGSGPTQDSAAAAGNAPQLPATGENSADAVAARAAAEEARLATEAARTAAAGGADIPTTPADVGAVSEPAEPGAREDADDQNRAQGEAAAAAPPEPEPRAPLILTFGEPIYQVGNGQEFEVTVIGSHFPAGTSIPVEILYNPQLLSFVSGTRGNVELASFAASADPSRGLLTMTIGLPANGVGAQQEDLLARIRLRGAKSGISYLVYRAPVISLPEGRSVNAQVRASRVVVQ